HAVDISPEQLAREIKLGKTIVPAYLNKEVDGKITRSKDCWTSQEILCIDYDNEIMIDNPEYPHRSNDKKIKVKNITMSLEDAMDKFKNDAMFIYTSFNHKPDHPKFRVVRSEEHTSELQSRENLVC